MFNPEFDGQENPVHSIVANVTVLSQQTLPNGRIELTTMMGGNVLTTENDGWSFNTRAVFELVSREGFLRIVKITEVDAILAGRSVDENSWGRVKALYRSPIPTNLTDPVLVIESHERALRERDYNAYAALLDQTFEFYPLERDAADMPWLLGDSWPQSDELILLENLFSSIGTGGFLEVDIPVLAQRDLGEGRVELTCDFLGRLLISSSSGWAFDTRLIFELVPRNGFLRIAKVTESESILMRPRVEESSWGSIKGLFK